MSSCLSYALIITYIRTFIMVTFDTGTNLPAVSWNSLLAVAMMNIRHRWNGRAVPTQSHPNAASLTLWALKSLEFYNECCVRYSALGWIYQLPGTPGLISDKNDPTGFARE